MSENINPFFLIEEYLAKKNIEEVEWQKGSNFSLKKGEIELNIGVHEEIQVFIIASYLGYLADPVDTTMLTDLLKANFAFQQSSVGAALGMTPDGELTLNIERPYAGLNVSIFDELLENMFSESHYWKNKLVSVGNNESRNIDNENIAASYLRI